MIKNVIPEWQIARLAQMLDRARNVVVTCHLSPDGDAIGSSLAMCALLRKMGKNANVILPDQLPTSLQFIAKEEITPVVYTYHRQRADELLANAHLLICLDFNALKRVDRMADAVVASGAQRILIDHHEDPEVELFKLWLSYPEMSSTCELVTRIVLQAGWKPLVDRFIARCLYLGIMTDTGNFVHDNSDNPELFNIASILMRYNIDKHDLYERAMNTFSLNAIRLQGFALSRRMKIYPEKAVALISLSIADLEEFNYHKGDTEGLVNRPLTAPDVRCVVYLREEKTYIKVSMRCKAGMTVNDLCSRYFNGGGHDLAAGGDYHGTLEEAEAVVEKMIADLQPVENKTDATGTFTTEDNH